MSINYQELDPFYIGQIPNYSSMNKVKRGIDYLNTDMQEHKHTGDDDGMQIPNSGLASDYASLAKVTNGAMVSIYPGYIGIGTTNPGTEFSVYGSGTIGTGYATGSAPENGLAVEGNVGIGTTNPSNKLGVYGNVGIGTPYATFSAPTDGLIVKGSVGIATNEPGSRLSVFGNVGIGTIYSTVGAPSNGLAVEGSVGIGVTVPAHKLELGTHTTASEGIGFGTDVELYRSATDTLRTPDTFIVDTAVGIGTTNPGTEFSVYGSGTIGTGYATGLAPLNGLAVQGNVGIGTTNPSNKLGVYGNVGIGTPYATFSAPTDGLIVKGSVGIATNEPGSKLSVFGNVGIGTIYSTVGAPSNGLAVEGNVGIGIYEPTHKLELGTHTGVTGGIGFGTDVELYRSAADTLRTPDTFIVDTAVGIGTTNPGTEFSVYGSGTIGTGYATGSAPENGLAVQGNVGVGTTNPSNKVDIYGNVGIGAGISTLFAGGIAPTNGLAVQSDICASGDINLGGNLESNGNIHTVGSVGIGTTNPSNKLQVIGHIDNLSYGNLYTSGIGIGTGNVQTFQLYATGDIYAGTLAADSLDNPGIVYSNVSRVLTNTNPSSIEYKKDIKPIEINYNKIIDLQLKSFTWKNNGKKDIGYIAEEVKEIIPELYQNDGKTIGYDISKLPFYIIELLKEQEKRIQELEKKLNK